MFHRMTLTSPFIVPWEQGAFITYTNFMVSRQILIWLDAAGTIVNEDSVALPYVPYAYVDGGQAKLVCQTDNPFQRTSTFIQRTFNNQGDEVRRDTLLVQQFAVGESGAIPGFDYAAGVLTIAAGRVRTSQDPWQYALRIVQHSAAGTVVFPAWDPGAIPSGANIFAITVKRTSGGGVIGFVVQGGGMTPELRFRSYDEQGQPGTAVRTIALPSWATLNGLSLLLSGGSVYPCYTVVNHSGGTGGAYVAAFPIDQILPVDPWRESPVAHEFRLSAYPNPFNSAVRIDYSLPNVRLARLDIVDITGRRVAEFALTDRSRSGSLVWSAADRASGTYFVRLHGGAEQRTQKLMLLR